MRVKGKIILVLLLAFILFIINPIISNAALQANGASIKKDNIANWLINVRRMESAGGTLGLSDTINSTTLVSNSNESNNLDIHMQKNTEYGAMAILSASAYGNPNKINSGETTTGNKSGVHIYLNQHGDGEWVSAGSTQNAIFQNIKGKYVNEYTTSYVAKRGDAINETYGWHANMGDSWWSWIIDNKNSHLVRGNYHNSIFSYDSGVYGAYTANYASRAVIVVGNGF